MSKLGMFPSLTALILAASTLAANGLVLDRLDYSANWLGLLGGVLIGTLTACAAGGVLWSMATRPERSSRAGC